MEKIKISYELFGGLKTNLPSQQGTIEIDNNVTIEKFINEIAGIEKRYFKYLDVTVDGKHLPFEKKLKNNSKIRILLPIGGG